MRDHLTVKTGIAGLLVIVVVGGAFVQFAPDGILGPTETDVGPSDGPTETDAGPSDGSTETDAGPPDGPTEIDSCTTIDQPGRYELTDDIAISGEGTCINITASDVLLDGRGHRLYGSYDNTTAVSIESPSDDDTAILSGVTVQNLTITGWDNGIVSEGSNSRITNIQVVESDIGIWLRNSSGGTITNNSISRGDYGIRLQNSSGGTITNNSVDVEHYVIDLRNSSESTITNNSLFRGLYGIELRNSSGSTVTNNSVDMSIYGIRLQNSNESTVTNNFVDSRDNGIELRNSSGSTVTNNSIDTNDNGIELNDSNKNTVTNNTITEAENGIQQVESDENTVTNNTVTQARMVSFGWNPTESFSRTTPPTWASTWTTLQPTNLGQPPSSGFDLTRHCNVQ